jgi:hypothetical protein
MSARRLPARAIATAVALSAALAAVPSCAHPYRGPKTLAAIGTALLVADGTTWAVADRNGRNQTATAGLIGAAVGAAVVMAAGGLLATTVGCAADPDCPEGEVCKEVPAPPGREPYRQCVPR